MRKRLLIVLAIELLLVIGLGEVVHVDRQERARAFMEWHQHPSSETHHAFERQKRITETQRWAFIGVVFAVLAGGTVLACQFPRGGSVTSGDGGKPGRGPGGQWV